MFFFGWQEGFLQILQIPPPFSSSKPPLKTISHSQNGFIFPHFSGAKKPPTGDPVMFDQQIHPGHCQIERTDLRWPGVSAGKPWKSVGGLPTPFPPPKKKGDRNSSPHTKIKNGK